MRLLAWPCAHAAGAWSCGMGARRRVLMRAGRAAVCLLLAELHRPLCPPAEDLPGKLDKMALKEEKQQQVVLEEIAYNEGEIMKAFEQLMAQDPRWGGGAARVASPLVHTASCATTSIQQCPVQGVWCTPRCSCACPRREHSNIVFIGHIDAGKSTLAGQILFTTVSARAATAGRLVLCLSLAACTHCARTVHTQGGVDKRTIEKYERWVQPRAPALAHASDQASLGWQHVWGAHSPWRLGAACSHTGTAACTLAARQRRRAARAGTWRTSWTPTRRSGQRCVGQQHVTA